MRLLKKLLRPGPGKSEGQNIGVQGKPPRPGPGKSEGQNIGVGPLPTVPGNRIIPGRVVKKKRIR